MRYADTNGQCVRLNRLIICILYDTFNDRFDFVSGKMI